MKKGIIVGMVSLILLTSCGTYTSTGASLGGILGSAIGGIAGGGRGSDIGTIIGMAGGAIIGAAADNRVQQRERQEVHDHYERVMQNKEHGYNSYNGISLDTDDMYSNITSEPFSRVSPSTDPSGFDSLNTGDDRLYDFNGSDYAGNYSAVQPVTKVPSQSGVVRLADGYEYTPNISIVNARFVDDNQDGVLSRGELGKIIFEIMNNGDHELIDVQPSVLETSGNTHIYISPSVHIESLMPSSGVRYTAIVKADNKLKNGLVKFAITVLQGRKSISKVTEFVVQTKK